MKYFLPLLFICFTSSCVKDYTCTCKTTSYDKGAVDSTYTDKLELTSTSKKQAKEACNVGDADLMSSDRQNGMTTDCELN